MPAARVREDFHFGCCMACRAPFMQDAMLFSQVESQAVFWLQMRFKQISRGGLSSNFTGRMEGSHLLSSAHYRYAFRFGRDLPAARIPMDIRGWNAVLRNVTFSEADSFVLVKSRLDNIRDSRVSDDAAEQALVDRASKAMEDYRADARDAGASTVDYEEKMVRKMVKEVTSKTANSFLAAWKLPPDANAVPHPGLRLWLGNNWGRLKKVEIDEDFVVPCCSLCNDIWDCWARMRQVLTESGIVPQGAVAVERRGTRAVVGDRRAIPVPLRETYAKVTHQARLGCLAGYYMHGALASLTSPRFSSRPLDFTRPNGRDLRGAISMLLWIPLHVTCMKMELMGPLNAAKKDASGSSTAKGMHNYLGNLDLLIAYYLWICALAQYGDTGELEFGRFSNFYVKELAYAPPPVWDAALHPRLSDYVFDTASKALGTREKITHVSNRLIALYEEVVAPIVPYMLLANTVDPAKGPAFGEIAAAYFASNVECTAFMASYNHLENLHVDNIKYFMDYMGVSALLWQTRRYLLGENRQLIDQLDVWIARQHMEEWKNAAFFAFGDAASFAMGGVLCHMQYALMPQYFLGPGVQLGSGAEKQVLQSKTLEEISELIEAHGNCSLPKAAMRMRRWNFTVSSRPPVIFNPFDEDGEIDGEAKYLYGRAFTPLSLDPRGRFIVAAGKAADLCDEAGHASERRRGVIHCMHPGAFQDALRRLRILDSLRERWISARLDIMPAISAELEVQGAGIGGFDARRRGCSGR